MVCYIFFPTAEELTNLSEAEPVERITESMSDVKINEPNNAVTNLEDETVESARIIATNNDGMENTERKEKRVTNKEKKKMKKKQEYEQQMEALTKKGGQGQSELDSNFTMSQVQKTGGQKAALEHAVDIKIENFTISAKGNDLFHNANLLIAHGR